MSTEAGNLLNLNKIGTEAGDYPPQYLPASVLFRLMTFSRLCLLNNICTEAVDYLPQYLPVLVLFRSSQNPPQSSFQG